MAKFSTASNVDMLLQASGFIATPVNAPNGMYWTQRDKQKKLDEINESNFRMQKSNLNLSVPQVQGKNKSILAIQKALNQTPASSKPKIQTNYTSGSAPTVRFPNLRPQSFTPLKTNPVQDGSGLLTSKFLPKGLIK